MNKKTSGTKTKRKKRKANEHFDHEIPWLCLNDAACSVYF